MSRFDYVKYDDNSVFVQDFYKKKFMELEESLVATLREPRAKALVLTHLEEAYMWIGKAIRDDQITLRGDKTLQENRNNS